jgi:hypothetical protein
MQAAYFTKKSLFNKGAQPSKHYEKVHIQTFLTGLNLYA